MPEDGVMDCNELVELVTAYLENTLPTADRERFDGHLLECPYCVIYLGQMKATLAALGSIPPETVDAGSRDVLLDAFRNWKKST